MKKSAPKPKTRRKQAKTHFPRNSRAITEQPPIVPPVPMPEPPVAFKHYWKQLDSFSVGLYKRIFRRFTRKEKQFFLIGSTLLLFVAIMTTGYTLQKSMEEARSLQAQKIQLTKEFTYWLGVVKEHKEYRDGYLHLALAAEKVGKRTVARESVKKAIQLDPNSVIAKELEEYLRSGHPGAKR